MKYLKTHENFNEYNEDDYIGYKRYLGFPPLIVKIIRYYPNSNRYFIELLEPPHTTYIVDKHELQDLTDEQIETIKTYLTANKYNI